MRRSLRSLETRVDSVGVDGSDPLARSAFRAALTAIALVFLAATIAAAVRLLPWVLDPRLSWAALSPFAKSLFAVGSEAAVLTGWPVGWAVAVARFVDRGEARVLASLGESPGKTLARLAPQAGLLAAVLGTCSLAFGRDAASPGRVVDKLLAEGRIACLNARTAETQSVPFVSATWLCVGGQARLAGKAPVGEGIFFTAARARVSDDLRRIELEDARLVRLTRTESTPSPAAVAGSAKAEPSTSAQPATAAALRLHVDALALRGLPPWARASALAPVVRAVVVTISALCAGCATVLALLRARRRFGLASAVTIGASGPLAALLVLRTLEVRMPDVPPEQTAAGWLVAVGLVPIAATIAVALLALLHAFLPERRPAGTT